MITIVDHGGGNLRSVQRACSAVGLESELSAEPAKLAKAERIIFPGVGHAQTAMTSLHETGVDQALREAKTRGTPIFGICVGAQVLLEECEEGPTTGFGFIPGVTRRFRLSDPQLKVPHMGWNEVTVTQPHPLLAGLEPGDEFYFVHSFYPAPDDPRFVYATSEHGGRFCCAVGVDNVFATQFHPEKSGRLGLEMLKRFATWNG